MSDGVPSATRYMPVPACLTIKPGGEYICRCVNHHTPKPNILHSHHVWPLGEGGPNIQQNLLWLCLPGDMPVTMANGSLHRIDTVRVGDVVLGHDGEPHHVTGVRVSSSEESIVRLDDLLLTADHLVLTRSGWLPAGALRKGDEVCRLQALSERVESHVFSLVPAEPQVFRPIVVGDEIYVMDHFGASEGSAENILHDETGSLHFAPIVSVPYDEDDVPLVVEPSTAFPFSGARSALESSESAVVAAELGGACTAPSYLRSEGVAAFQADLNRGWSAAVRGRAGVGAGGVAAGQRCRHLEIFVAGGTALDSERDVAACERRWDALTHVERVSHSGFLYDITIAGSQSFVAGGLAVHNCPTTHMNVHELWRLMDKLSGQVPWEQARQYSSYVRQVVKRGWDQKASVQKP